MHPFEFTSATAVDEAVALLAGHGEDARVLGGGTDLIAQLKEGRRAAALVVDVKRIPELTELRLDGNRARCAFEEVGGAVARRGWR